MCILDRFDAEPDPAAGWRLDIEHDHVYLGSDRKCLRDVGFTRHVRLAHRDQAGAAGAKEYEDAELLVTFDLSPHARARHNLR